MRNILILIVSGLFFVGCGQQQDAVKTTERQTKNLSVYFQKAQEEKLILLALKYNLNSSIVEMIIGRYSRHDPYSVAIKKTQPEEPIEEAILDLSSQLGIPKETVAALIIDYKILRIMDYLMLKNE